MPDSKPRSINEMQLTALTIRGLLRGLDDLGRFNDPRHMDICVAMAAAAVPLAEKLADDLSELNDSQTESKTS